MWDLQDPGSPKRRILAPVLCADGYNNLMKSWKIINKHYGYHTGSKDTMMYHLVESMGEILVVMSHIGRPTKGKACAVEPIGDHCYVFKLSPSG